MAGTGVFVPAGVACFLIVASAVTVCTLETSLVVVDVDMLVVLIEITKNREVYKVANSNYSKFPKPYKLFNN